VVTRDLPKVETTGSSPVARSPDETQVRPLSALLAGLLLLFPATAIQAAPPPPQSLVDRSTLSILRGGGQYSEQARGPIVAAVDGQDVAVGDRVISGPDTNLVLTFFEGSTFTITPNTDIIVERLQGDQTSRDFSLRLNAGTIWARVVSLVNPVSRFEVRTPTAVAVVRGSQIGARVLPDGTFQCWTREGAMSVQTSTGQQADLVPGETVLVQPDGQIAAQRPFEPAASLLRFDVRGSVWSVVVHPDGGANGIVDPGVVASQTFGALVTPYTAAAGALAFEVPANVSGRYLLVLHGRIEAPEPYSVLVTGLLAPIYAGTSDEEERLVAGEEAVGAVPAGQTIAIAVDVAVEDEGSPDARLSSLSVSGPLAVEGPLGPARVYVSPFELALRG
jgi:hypothetical protein